MPSLYPRLEIYPITQSPTNLQSLYPDNEPSSVTFSSNLGSYDFSFYSWPSFNKPSKDVGLHKIKKSDDSHSILNSPLAKYLNSSANKKRNEEIKKYVNEFFKNHASEIIKGIEEFTYDGKEIRYTSGLTEEEFRKSYNRLKNNTKKFWKSHFRDNGIRDKEVLYALYKSLPSCLSVPRIKIEEKTYIEKIKEAFDEYVIKPTKNFINKCSRKIRKKNGVYLEAQETSTKETNSHVYQTQTSGAEINVGPTINYPKRYLIPSKNTLKSVKGKKNPLLVGGTVVILLSAIAGGYLLWQHSQDNANQFAGEVEISGKTVPAGEFCLINLPGFCFDSYNKVDPHTVIPSDLVFGSEKTFIVYKDAINSPVKEFKAIGKPTQFAQKAEDLKNVQPDPNSKWILAREIKILSTWGQQTEKSNSLYPSLDPTNNSTLYPTAADLHASTPALTELIETHQDFVAARKELIDLTLSHQLAEASA
jgi:hypothetical protein